MGSDMEVEDVEDSDRRALFQAADSELVPGDKLYIIRSGRIQLEARFFVCFR